MTAEEMTAGELKPIVEAWGGRKKFADLLNVSPKAVEHWLKGKRRIRPMVAKFIRTLQPPPP